MTTKMTSRPPKPAVPVTSLIWGPGEVYVCGDPDCRSKVLVLESPFKESAHPTLPRCFCGNILEIAGSVASVPEDTPAPSGEGPKRDPAEERE
jgi:hypothetical protein